jgi:hypothetical protein
VVEFVDAYPFKQGFHYMAQDKVYLDGLVYTCNPETASICAYVWPDDSEGISGIWLPLQKKANKVELPEVAKYEAVPSFWAGEHPEIFYLRVGDHV